MRPIHLTFSLLKTSQPDKQRNEGHESFTEVCFDREKIRNSQYSSIIKKMLFFWKINLYFILHTYLSGWTPAGNCATFTRWKFLVCQFQRTSDLAVQKETFLQLWANTLIKMTYLWRIPNFTATISMNINLYSAVVTMYTACRNVG